MKRVRDQIPTTCKRIQNLDRISVLVDPAIMVGARELRSIVDGAVQAFRRIAVARSSGPRPDTDPDPPTATSDRIRSSGNLPTSSVGQCSRNRKHSKTGQEMKTINTKEAASRLNVSVSQFRWLANKRGIEPADYYINPGYFSGPMGMLWATKIIGPLKHTKLYKQMVDRNASRSERWRLQDELDLQKRESERLARREKFEHRYASKEFQLVLDSANAMFELNRYAKHDDCHPWTRRRIYNLKSPLIRCLEQRGYCESTAVHLMRVPAKECFGCDGGGMDYDTGRDCYRCGGTGEFKPATEFRFIAFQFQVGDVKYRWHQPEHLVDWTYTPTSEIVPINETEIKPVKISVDEIPDLMDTIRYLIELPFPVLQQN